MRPLPHAGSKPSTANHPTDSPTENQFICRQLACKLCDSRPTSRRLGATLVELLALTLGFLHVEGFLARSKGFVSGSLVTDAKNRIYRQAYAWKDKDALSLVVHRIDGAGDKVIVPKNVPLTRSLIAFFGLYSGDGSKGTEDRHDRRRIIPTVSFSQTEPNLVRFAVDHFRVLFPGALRFTFSLGEDSAYFMAGEGADALALYYKGKGHDQTPSPKPLKVCRPTLDVKDLQYLQETRPDVLGSNESHLSFYYTHKQAMEEILSSVKEKQLKAIGIDTTLPEIKVTASLRRPFKKGARVPGGSSRADEIHVGGLSGVGELFLKMLHEIEDSILRDVQQSSSSLVEWNNTPSLTGNVLDLKNFFGTHPYGIINLERPKSLVEDGDQLVGQWRRSSVTTIARNLRLDPLWCYTSGLYLAEGTTDKNKLFAMCSQTPGALSLGFTSSEGTSIELMLRTLSRLVPMGACLDAWKVKVGSQYFPELVVNGLKNGVAMLRGGASGDGKLRTMEISLAVKQWALEVADAALHGRQSMLSAQFADRYSHVEPTGSGVARIDFWASSTVCRWYFPILMYAVFGEIVTDPVRGFYR